MNILPKKRWHVRTRENIARVRRDEATAAKEEEEKQRRIKLAEQEARTNLLRAQARSKYDGREDVKEGVKKEVKKEVGIVNADGHVNFFAELEQGLVSGTATNKEHDEELKQEREKYEKQIGYLTYLGQDTNEATGNVSWYNKNPSRDIKPEKDDEIGLKHKLHNDPLNSVKQFCFSGLKAAAPSLSTCFKRKRTLSSSEDEKQRAKKSKKEKKKRKKSKHKQKKKKGNHHSSDSEYSDSTEEEDIEKKRKLNKLRAERVRREEEEKKRSEKLLAKVNGVPYVDKDKPEPKPAMQQKYNSQFNPTLARQNYRE